MLENISIVLKYCLPKSIKDSAKAKPLSNSWYIAV